VYNVIYLNVTKLISMYILKYSKI